MGLQELVMVDDDRGDEEQQKVVETKGYFIPRRPRSGDQLGDHILNDEHEPHEAVGMRKDIAPEGLGQRPPQYPVENGHQANQYERADDSPKRDAPVVLVADVNIEPAFQAVLDGDA